ncbi:hypothetical protein HanXRQr2_Chr11g0502531 [Helianthus annuus]|uniref:Uncharacterized protein n=1 Tax=Helianthus annuus TaxID=4232 RepID=A0A9K3N0Z9_HELAN|nr:hypothetical protein HanXRQr2_Chr11g0502531 [Helianthus annuus]
MLSLPYALSNHWVSAQWPPARILTRRWRVRVLLVPNAPTVADLPPDSGLLGGGLRGGITSAVGRTVEYPPPPHMLCLALSLR